MGKRVMITDQILKKDRVEVDLFQGNTAVESVVSKMSQRGRQLQARDLRGLIERIVANAGALPTFLKSQSNHVLEIIEQIRRDSFHVLAHRHRKTVAIDAGGSKYAVVFRKIRQRGNVVINGFQRSTFRKSIDAQGCQTFGQGNSGKGLASRESTVAQCSQGIGQQNLGHRSTIQEGGIADGEQSLRQDHAFKMGMIVERIWTDGSAFVAFLKDHLCHPTVRGLIEQIGGNVGHVFAHSHGNSVAVFTHPGENELILIGCVLQPSRVDSDLAKPPTKGEAIFSNGFQAFGECETLQRGTTVKRICADFR